MLATATPPASTGLAALCAATATVVVVTARREPARALERLDERGVFAGVGLALADVVLDGTERIGLAAEPLRLEAAADPLRLDAAVDPLRLDAADPLRLDAADRAPFDAAVDPLRRDVAPFALAVLVGSAIGSSVRTALHLRSFSLLERYPGAAVDNHGPTVDRSRWRPLIARSAERPAPPGRV